MAEAQPTTDETPHDRAYLMVTRAADGRYCVAYIDGSVSRRSYTPSLDQVIRQAQRAGGLPIRTDDGALRQRCQDEALPLL